MSAVSALTAEVQSLDLRALLSGELADSTKEEIIRKANEQHKRLRCAQSIAQLRKTVASVFVYDDDKTLAGTALNAIKTELETPSSMEAVDKFLEQLRASGSPAPAFVWPEYNPAQVNDLVHAGLLYLVQFWLDNTGAPAAWVRTTVDALHDMVDMLRTTVTPEYVEDQLSDGFIIKTLSDKLRPHLGEIRDAVGTIAQLELRKHQGTDKRAVVHAVYEVLLDQFAPFNTAYLYGYSPDEVKAKLAGR